MAPTTVVALMGDVHASSLGSGEAMGVGSTPRTALQEGAAAKAGPAARPNPGAGIRSLHRAGAESLRMSRVAVACSALYRLGCNVVCIFPSSLFHYFRMPGFETWLRFKSL